MIKNLYQNKYQVLIGLLLMVILTAVSVIPVNAAYFDEDGLIEKDEVIDDDVFISGENVIVDGTVNGILFASADTVTINGTIKGDALLAGSTVIVSKNAVIDGNLAFGGRELVVEGKVTGSIFGGANTLFMKSDSSVGRNLFYGGYALVYEKGSKIARDLYVGAAQASLNGEIGRDLHAGAEAVELNGRIGRDVVVQVGNPDANDDVDFNNPMFSWFAFPGMPKPMKPGLRVSENAEIGGKLQYTSPVKQEYTIQSKPKDGIVYLTPIPDETATKKGKADTSQGFGLMMVDWVTGIIRDLITLFVLGTLALWLIPSILGDVGVKLKTKALPSAGIGVVIILGVTIAILLMAVMIFLLGILMGIISLGGLSFVVFSLGYLSLMFISLIFTVLVIYGSHIIVAYLGGDWVMTHLAPNAFPSPDHRKYVALAVGVLIYVVLRSIPVIGWLVGLIVAIAGIGAMYLYYRDWRQSRGLVAAD